MPKGYYTNPRTRGRMQGTVLPSVKRQYFGRLEASPAEQALRGGNLRYDGGILWAYATIVREERRTGLFARMSDDQFGDAVRAAIMADRGHEKSYVDPEWEDDEIGLIQNFGCFSTPKEARAWHSPALSVVLA